MSAVLELNPIPGAAPPDPPPAEAPKQPSVLEMTTALIEKAKTPNSGVDMAVLTKMYLKIRDAKKDVDEQAKAKTSPLVQAMDALESFFLAKMIELNLDSLKNEAGTPYKTEKTSVTVADNESFVGWVLDKSLESLPVSPEAKAKIKTAILDSGAFAYIESRASKTAVEAYIEQTKELPPGLNRRVETAVNVRTS